MAKKKTYQPPKDSDWDYESDKEHRRTIKEKETYIRNKYKRGWDKKNHK